MKNLLKTELNKLNLIQSEKTYLHPDLLVDNNCQSKVQISQMESIMQAISGMLLSLWNDAPNFMKLINKDSSEFIKRLTKSGFVSPQNFLTSAEQGCLSIETQEGILTV